MQGETRYCFILHPRSDFADVTSDRPSKWWQGLIGQFHPPKVEVGVGCSEKPNLRQRISLFTLSILIAEGVRGQAFVWRENQEPSRDTGRVGSNEIAEELCVRYSFFPLLSPKKWTKKFKQRGPNI